MDAAKSKHGDPGIGFLKYNSGTFTEKESATCHPTA